MGTPPEHSKFKKGQSGNPKGRPPKLPQLDKLLDNVLGEEKDGMTAAEAILKALRLKAAKGDVRAAEVLLDRAYGKAKQSILQENTGEQTIKIIREVIHENPKD
jgi:hypothetical protein